MEAYSGAPLPKKLGIKPGTLVFLAGAPEDFEKKLGDLPAGIVDYRVCAVDETWSGLLFALRKA